jgi:hypothetical protein
LMARNSLSEKVMSSSSRASYESNSSTSMVSKVLSGLDRCEAMQSV